MSRPPTLRSSTLDTWLPALLVVLLAAAWFTPIAVRMIGGGDYPDHLRTAQAVAAAPHLPAPHFMYFAAVAAVLTTVPSLPLRTAGLVVTVGFQFTTALVLWWYLRRTSHSLTGDVPALVTLALMIAGPVLPPMVQPDVFLVGFFPPNPYHNATIIAARPFALGLAIAAAAALGMGQIRVRPWTAIALVVLSAVSKPNYMLCVVPALALLVIGRVVMRRAVQWSLVLSIAIPAAALVLLMREAYGAKGIEVVVAPFAAVRFHSAADWTLALKFLASVAFPLTVVLLWPRVVFTHGELQVAWAAMVIALLQAYLLAEAGPRIDHANLLAGGSLAVFVLMAASCSAMFSRPLGGYDRLRLAIAAVVFVLHIWGGVRHVLVTMTFQRWLTPLTYVALAATVFFVAFTSRSTRHR